MATRVRTSLVAEIDTSNTVVGLYASGPGKDTMAAQVNILSVGGVQVLAKSGVAVSGAADTAENTLATVTIPGGSLGANGMVRINHVWSITASTNSKTARIRFSGAAGTIFFTRAETGASQASLSYTTWIWNRNSEASQVGGATGGSNNAGSATQSVVTATVNTAADTTLVFTGQKASAGEAITLEGYNVDIVYGV